MARPKYTYEQVRQEFDLRGYDLISTEYRGANYKLEYICRKHQDKGILTIDFKHFHDRGQGCRYCALEKPSSRRISDSKIIELCKKHGFTFIKSDSDKQHTVVYFICNKHKEKGIQKMNVVGLKKKRIGCRYCAGNVRKSHIDFLIELKQINPNIKVLSRYSTSTSPIECECLLCGHVWKTTPNRLLSAKTGCKYCGYKKLSESKTKTHAQFINELSLKKPNIISLEFYQGAKTKIKFKCTKCNHVFSTSPDQILHSKFGCPKCAQSQITKSQTKTHQEFLSELSRINPDLEPLETYKTDHTKILMRCKIHNYEWRAAPNKILHRRTGCPKCSVSTNENKICDILDKWGFKYALQQRFAECRDKYSLPFDIYLIDENILIEYDGEAHFIPIQRTASESKRTTLERLHITQHHDEIKNKYCQKHNIPLIRVPYWEQDNLEYFLWDELVKYGAIEEIANAI